MRNMKHIKSIDKFLLEALRDTWRETVKDSIATKNDKYFNLEWSHDLHTKIVSELIELIVTDKYETDWTTHKRENFYYDSDGRYDEEDEEIDEDDFWENEDNQDGFVEFLEDDVEETLQELYYTLSDNEHNKKIDIYREIDVNQIWLDLFLNKENDEVHLGEYWAYDEESTDTYWAGNKKHKVKFHAKVLQTDINWWDTYWANLLHPEECEINLFPNTPLELVSITIDGEDVDLSNFKNKEIYA